MVANDLLSHIEESLGDLVGVTEKTLEEKVEELTKKLVIESTKRIQLESLIPHIKDHLELCTDCGMDVLMETTFEGSDGYDLLGSVTYYWEKNL